MSELEHTRSNFHENENKTDTNTNYEYGTVSFNQSPSGILIGTSIDGKQIFHSGSSTSQSLQNVYAEEMLNLSGSLNPQETSLNPQETSLIPQETNGVDKDKIDTRLDKIETSLINMERVLMKILESLEEQRRKVYFETLMFHIEKANTCYRNSYGFKYRSVHHFVNYANKYLIWYLDNVRNFGCDEERKFYLPPKRIFPTVCRNQ